MATECLKYAGALCVITVVSCVVWAELDLYAIWVSFGETLWLALQLLSIVLGICMGAVVAIIPIGVGGICYEIVRMFHPIFDTWPSWNKLVWPLNTDPYYEVFIVVARIIIVPLLVFAAGWRVYCNTHQYKSVT
jgi:hypothetical protein